MERLTKTSYILLATFILGSIGHNLFYALTNVEEGALFILALVVFALFLVSLLVNVVLYLRRGSPKDIWKLGWIGLLGLFGFIPGFGVGFFGLYGFFGFFGFRKK